MAGGTGDDTREGVNLHYLRLFLAVARAGTFSGAAEALHTSQPALSRQIAVRMPETAGRARAGGEGADGGDTPVQAAAALTTFT